MTPEQLREYATTLIVEHARDVEFLTIFEMAEDHCPGGNIAEDDANAIADLIIESTVTVSWPEPAGSGGVS